MRVLARPLTARSAASFLLSCLALTASAQEPSELPEGRFPPLLVQAARSEVVVRAEPGFLYKELRKLERGERVTAVRRQGRWLGLRPEGWVPAEEMADATQPLPPEGPVLLRVIADGVRLRSGPGTEHEIVGGRSAGDVVEVLERQGDWWRLAEGGWVHSSLVEAPDPDAEAGPDGAGAALLGPTGERVRRWSYMDLHGTLFEVFEIDPRTPFLAGLRRAMRETGVLEDDWTYMRLVISVPKSRFTFKYSPGPEGNPVSVWDRDGNRFGSVYAQGPLGRIPMHLRAFFQEQEIGPGERFEGLLMFRPTLDARRIETVKMVIGGRPRSLFETP